MGMNIDDIKVMYEGQGHRSRSPYPKCDFNRSCIFPSSIKVKGLKDQGLKVKGHISQSQIRVPEKGRCCFKMDY